MALLDKFVILLFLFCYTSVHSYEYIPVYMWETTKNYSPLPALGRINEEFFRDILLDKFNKDKIVLVFLEENLSPEDFTTFDTNGESVFYSLSDMKYQAQVNYYPFVEAPLKALQSLPGVRVLKVDVTSDGLPSDIKIEPGQVLIVDLNDAKENEDRSHMLRRHDSLVASIYKAILLNYDNIIALYTARHSSWLVPSELDNNGIGRKARHLMANKEKSTDHILMQQTSTLLYVKTPLVFNITNANKMVELKEPKSIDIIDENRTRIADETGVNVTFTFQTHLGYWFFKNILIAYEELNYEFNISDIYAPTGFSYHCNNTIFKFENTTDKYFFTMPGLQVQRFPGNKTPEAFDDAYDCVGFTTAPIWTGLFVTFILAMIMTFGLCMIMDIKTMDRFDDPKGKTISINVVE